MPETYVLTPTAEKNIREIAEWSMQRWGIDKTTAYLISLHEGLEYISKHFKTFSNNKTRSDLNGGTGLSLYPVNRHYVVFLPIGEKTIAVAAIIRQGRDIPALLRKNGVVLHRDIEEIENRLARGEITLPKRHAPKLQAPKRQAPKRKA